MRDDPFSDEELMSLRCDGPELEHSPGDREPTQAPGRRGPLQQQVGAEDGVATKPLSCEPSARVRHRRWGDGTIRGSEPTAHGQVLLIEFDVPSMAARGW